MRASRWSWTLSRADCTGCGICADVCPHSAISLPRDRAYPEAVAGNCSGCRLCEAECPFGAIALQLAQPVRTPAMPERAGRNGILFS